MSHSGKMQRGEKLYSYRNLDNKLPFEITRDTHKMEEINYFLTNSQTVEETTKPKVVKSTNKK